MQRKHIPFQETGYFSKLICDYLDQKTAARSLYNNFPDKKGFQNQIALKKKHFSKNSRTVLVKSLEQQYKDVSKTKLTTANIASLSDTSTFTVVTGHQLNLFTGPLYFLYKIASTLNLAKELKEQFPENHFVPVYWMASEDHDFDEINHFFVNNNRISWDVPSSGAVGGHDTKGLKAVLEDLSKAIGSSANATYLKNLFQKAYLEKDTLTAATRYLVNELFGDYGLVIVDGDDKLLKEEFVPFAQKELSNQVAIKALAATNTYLDKNYKVQVSPREINLFYCRENLRERILLEGNHYKINNTALRFTKAEILAELQMHPGRFSPNVVLRPLYQEIVLPNLCCIGGGGELAYWLQLKELFAEFQTPYPILLLRNSALFLTSKQVEKLQHLQVAAAELFLPQEELFAKKTKQFSKLPLDFASQKETLVSLFNGLKPLVQQTDVSFEGALRAQEKKQLKGLEKLEKRLLKAEKKKLSGVLYRIKTLQDELFPRKGLQERNVNFSELYLEVGPELIPMLLQNLRPLEQSFAILEI
jgi:bacillithiol biosynthesis cysteine-adding enzyme BshC